MHQAPIPSPANSKPPTRVIALLNMLTIDELRDDQEYKDIYEDIEIQCQSYGTVQNLVIPRPSPDGINIPGVGKVFVEFARVEEAVTARKDLEGKQFSSRTVICDFFDEQAFANRQF